MNKVIRDGKVGVLVSHSYGGGFYTWGAPLQAIFDPKLIELVENEKYQEAVDYVEETYDVFSGGVDDLVVVWITEGTKFIIDEYDGFESIRLLDDITWITA